ncbi:MAG: hypothetical protein WAQ05_08055, partial [Rubrivivax sp.]
MTFELHDDAPPAPHGLALLGWGMSLLICTLAWLAVALPVQAAPAPASGRLTVTVDVEREAQTR